MSNLRGSIWQKWDLHVHTPDSLVQHYGAAGTETWDKFIDALSKLPSEFKVLGINDYIFLDGYKKVVAAKEAGKLPNIELLLPVIELRIDKFGGSKSGLSRVNYHIIFSNEISPEIIESQFLSALCSKYILTPQYEEIRTSGKWAAVPTRKSIEDLGHLIIGSVPVEERVNFHSPIIEGFNNLCLGLGPIKDVLSSHYFEGKTLTAVGKTEWADIKWNDQSIADKKSIINGADLVFISSANAEKWKKSRSALTEAKVNDRLLDCSDSHRYADSKDKDRLGKCFTWIKADPTFEGLRQALFEYPSRVCIGEQPPIEPFLQIKKVKLALPGNALLSRGGRTDKFCLRGGRDIEFSPFLTCIIGGRGTGKSTLLNLIHEKLDSGSTEFFRQNNLLPSGVTVDSGISIDGVTETGVVEFLQQNEIEQFATDHKRLTTAIFTRLRKLDASGRLKGIEASISSTVTAIEKQIERIRTYHEWSAKVSASMKELVTQKEIVESFQDAEYKHINDQLALLNKELQGLNAGKSRLDNLTQTLEEIIKDFKTSESSQPENDNAYEQQIQAVVEVIEKCIVDATAHPTIEAAKLRELEVTNAVKKLRAALDIFLKGRGLSQENLVDVGKASESVAQLEGEITSLVAKIDALGVELSIFVPQRDLGDQYAEIVNVLLAPINDDLKGQSEEVKPIDLHYQFDLRAFKKALIKYVTESLGLIEGRNAREDYVESKLSKIDFLNLESIDAIVDQIPDDSTLYSKTLRDFISKGVNFEMLKLQVELLLLNYREFGKIHIQYDNKPVENSSFGQRCTAVIVVLLLLGNMPIVIDEPEAHLDSSLIAKYLVDLIKSRKVHRQIIFATHNANIVINGDAELIHCLSMDDGNLTQVDSTTIENLDHRELLLTLEGGEKAFHQREKRYGID